MHLGKFAVSDVGMLVIEVTHVERRGRITHGCLGLNSDDNEAALARIVAFCRNYGNCKIGLQLSHSGRKGSAKLPWQERGAPLTPAEGGWPTPEPLDTAGIDAVIAAHAERIIAEGEAGMVALARGMLFDPHWAWRAAAALGAEVAFPPQYVRGYKFQWLQSLAVGHDPSC